jgi:hypothetical protein
MMKCSISLRLFAVLLMTVLLLANAPSVQAGRNGRNGRNGQNGQNGQPKSVPEGSAAAILILAAGALGGSVLVWRRKRPAIVA